jgi:hypothetical protein
MRTTNKEAAVGGRRRCGRGAAYVSLRFYEQFLRGIRFRGAAARSASTPARWLPEFSSTHQTAPVRGHRQDPDPPTKIHKRLSTANEILPLYGQ